MSDEIQQFTFQGQQLRTLADQHGEPWFIGKDVCDILGISNNRDAMEQLDDEKIPSSFPTEPRATPTRPSSANPAYIARLCAPANRRPGSSNDGSPTKCCPPSANTACTPLRPCCRRPWTIPTS